MKKQGPFFRLLRTPLWHGYGASCVIRFFCALSFWRAHPAARKALKPDAENRPYAVIEPKFYRSGNVFGLKEFPK